MGEQVKKHDDTQSEAYLDITQSAKGNIWADRLSDEQRLTALAIAQQMGFPDILSRVLAARGATAANIEGFINPTLKDLLPDPSSFVDMDKGAARIAQAIQNKEKIAIFGDYDVDGATSSALLARFAQFHGVETQIYIPDRIFEGYGPNPDAINQLIDEGAKLIVTVDCGTVSLEALAVAEPRDVDVVVIDHHLAGEALPNVTAVVNPNRQDDLSAQGHLAAGGVTFVMLVAIARTLRQQNYYASKSDEYDLLSLLDLVALATVCDVVPLKGVNRAFVQRGLEVMAKRQNNGLRALGDVAGLDQKPTVYHLGFMIGPRINAGGRIGDSGLGARLLTTDDDIDAREIAQTLDRLNTQRKAEEAAMLEDALSRADRLLEETPDLPMLMLGAPDWHKGLVGLVASRLCERFKRPTCILSWQGEEATGSLRSISGIDIGALVQKATGAGLLVKGGGHAMAAGLTVTKDKYEALYQFFNKQLDNRVAKANEGRRLNIDGALTPMSATHNLFDLLEKAGPYGMGHPSPRFVFPMHRIKFAKIVGDNHIKCTVAGSDNSQINAIAFRADDTPLGDLLQNNKGELLHIVGRLTKNSWGGRETIELQIEDAARPVTR